MNRVIEINDRSTLYVGRAAEMLDRVLPSGRVIVITDVNIDRLYPDLVHRYEHIIIGLGEATKNLATVENIYRQLMELGADRSTFLLGVGGGIVTDIVGYVAATYMRGLDFGFISTTLLGQVDASIGGKNGVNIADYKNMVGTFRQPRFVISDVEMLRTLPVRELRAGMAEAVKSAIVGDAALFDYIERLAANEEFYASTEQMQRIVLGAVGVKAHIVALDEREGGIRRLLNLGHTLGHAIEKSTRDVNHGEAVACGLHLIAEAACRKGVLAKDVCDRITALLARAGFVLEPPVAMSQLLKAVKKDKKAEGDDIYIVLPKNIGSCTVEKMPVADFKKMF